jgi:hypothetical protein
VFVFCAEFELHLLAARCEVLVPLLFYVGWQVSCPDIVQLLMMDQDFCWQTLQNPLMTNRLIWRQSLFRIPFQAFLNKFKRISFSPL